MHDVHQHERTMLHHRMNGGWLLLAARLAGCCLLFVTVLPGAAQNLVPNPSFEIHDTCPAEIGFQGYSKPLYWEKWNQSPEYFHSCAGGLGGADTLLGVPSNGFGYRYAWHGEAYVGMWAYDPWGEFREYIGCELLEPLEVGETYQLSFRTVAAIAGSYWWLSHVCNNMGLLFTMEPNIWTGLTGPLFALRNYAHLHSQAIVSDTTQWTLVSGSFVADSAYRYLVIGNFFSQALTDTMVLLQGPSLGAYYYVDGVCVTKGKDDCGFTTGIGEGILADPALFPNPVASLLTVRHGLGMRVEWRVHDMSGRAVGQGSSVGDRFALDVQAWLPGTYHLCLQGSGEVKQMKFVVMR